AMVHDLKQPLTSMKSNADELKKYAVDVAHDPAAAKEVLAELPSMAEDISGATDLMVDIVEDMRRFLRAERIQEDASTSPVPVIQTAVRLYKEAEVLGYAKIV